MRKTSILFISVLLLFASCNTEENNENDFTIEFISIDSVTTMDCNPAGDIYAILNFNVQDNKGYDYNDFTSLMLSTYKANLNMNLDENNFQSTYEEDCNLEFESSQPLNLNIKIIEAEAMSELCDWLYGKIYWGVYEPETDVSIIKGYTTIECEFNLDGKVIIASAKIPCQVADWAD